VHISWNVTKIVMQRNLWIESIGTIGSLLRRIKESAQKVKLAASSESQTYDKELDLATNLLSTFSYKLILTTRSMITTTKNLNYRKELKPLIELLGLYTLELVSVALKASKSHGYDPKSTQEVTKSASKVKDIVGDMVKVTVDYNKGRGAENKGNKDDFLFALKVMRIS